MAISTKKKIAVSKVDLPMTDLHSLLGGKLIFKESQDEEEVFHQDDLIRLSPFGVSITQDLLNPFVLLKDPTQTLTLPVAVHPLEASQVLNMGSPAKMPYSPHQFLLRLLEEMDIQVLQCVFVQMKETKQFVRLFFRGHPKVNSIKISADQAMSLCIALNIPIYATRSFINQSRLMNAQIEGVTSNLLQNQKILLKNTTYVQ